jgi:RDD family protein
MTAHALARTRSTWPGPAELAPPRMRVAAWAVDVIVVAALAAALAVAAVWFVREVLQMSDVWSAAAPWSRKVVVAAIAAGVVGLGYLGLGQAGSRRTLGKRLVGLRAVQMVRMPDGGLRLIELRIAVAVLRQFAHAADVPLLWGFLRPLWDRYHRTAADQLTGVFVVVDRDERCFEHERYLDRSAADQPEWWLCKQPDDEIWRPA